MTGAAPHVSRFIVLALFLVPIAAGLLVCALGAFGYYPGLEARGFGLHIWREALGEPGLLKAIGLTVFTSLLATIMAVILALALAERMMRMVPSLVNLITSTPHAAVASGLAFLIAPSGWFVRLLGFDAPLQMRTLYDPFGLGLTLGLIIKETPFLLMVTLTASAQIRAGAYVLQARTLGQTPILAWIKAAVPQIYPLIRLPIFAVLAFAISNVDMALILGPTNPPTLAVMIKRLVYSPDLLALLPASALSVILVAIAGAMIGFWCLMERGVKRWGRAWIFKGGRQRGWDRLVRVLRVSAMVLLCLGAFGLLCLWVWSVSWRWPFPSILPNALSLKFWQDWHGWIPALGVSLLIGVVATLISLALAIIWLEASPKPDGWAIYLPLVLPPLSFLFGVNLIYLQTGFTQGVASVIAAHILFVFPYILITLSNPWRQFDARFLVLAASFSQTPIKRLCRVKMPMMLRPLLLAAAIGFAVSIAQYLPTLFMGAGRVETLVTEAVTLSSSGDRRRIGLYGVLQMALPLAGFWLATRIPKWIYHNRRGMI